MGVAIILLNFVSAITAQIQSADSSTVRSDGDADLLFRIKWSRLQRLLQSAHPDSTGITSLPAEIQQLIREAMDYARQNDYDTAITFIDVVLNYLPERSVSQTSQAAETKGADVSTQVFCGSDLWQQKFSVSISDADSTIFEDQGNAFVGLRLAVNAHSGFLRQSRIYMEAKYSQEYLYGYLDVNRRSHAGARYSTYFENRLEGISYFKEKELRYWHNRTRALVAWQVGAKTTLSAEDEIQVRRYAYDSSLFSSYWQNQAALLLSCDLPLLSKTDIRYDFRIRQYQNRSAQNYFENLLTITLWPNLLQKNQFSSYTQLRLRDYHHGMVDSLLTNPFNELYHESSARVLLWQNLSLHLGLTLNLRHYRFYAEAMPDYRDLTGELALEYLFFSFGSIKIGYRNRCKHHYFSSPDLQKTAEIEDFYAHAPAVEVDIYLGRFLLNISNVYEIRRYPSSPDGSLSLYSDRDVNTLFLLLSWAISSKWEVNVMANIDNDWARNPYSSDSRSNIINFELLFKL